MENCKKFAVIDETTGDWFESVFDTEQEALQAGEYQWSHITPHDRKRRLDFYIAECEVDEDGCVVLDTTRIIKKYR